MDESFLLLMLGKWSKKIHFIISRRSNDSGPVRMVNKADAEYLYYNESSPVRYMSKSKMLRYLRGELKAKTISKKQYIAGVKGVEELSKK